MYRTNQIVYTSEKEGGNINNELKEKILKTAAIYQKKKKIKIKNKNLKFFKY